MSAALLHPAFILFQQSVRGIYYPQSRGKQVWHWHGGGGRILMTYTQKLSNCIDVFSRDWDSILGAIQWHFLKNLRGD